MSDTMQGLQSELTEFAKNAETVIGVESFQAARETFDSIDRNKDGKLDLTEVLDYLLEKERARLIEKFHYHDRNLDSYVDFDEFLLAVFPVLSVMQSFKSFDTDNDDLLAREEVLKIAEGVVSQTEHVSNERVAELFEQADRDRDEKLTFHELYGLLTHVESSSLLQSPSCLEYCPE